MSKKQKKFLKKFLISICAVGIFVCFGTIGLLVYSEYDKNSKQAMHQTNDSDLLNSSINDTDLSETEEDVIEPKESTGEGVSDDANTDMTDQLTDETEGNLQEDGEAVLLFGGDICFDEKYTNMYTLAKRGGDIRACFSEDILRTMEDADLFMLNNEFTYTTRGEPIAEKAFTFRTNPSNVKLLKDIGVDIVSLANNHAYDYGEISLFDTLETLENEEIPYVGAGRNIDEASKPACFTINGIKIAIVAATQIERLSTPDTRGATKQEAGVFRCFSESEFNRLLEVIKTAKAENDIVIAYIHWGTENTDELDWAQTYQAPQIVEAGADVIIGNHTHCLQQLDVIGGVPVIYSVGNFWFNSKKLDNCLIRITASKNAIVKLEFLPGIQENCFTSLAQGNERVRIFEYMRSISSNVTIDADGVVGF